MPEIKIERDGDPRSLLERWGNPTWDMSEVSEDMQAVAKAAVKVINGGVDLLRNPKAIRHHDINKLMANFWRLVANQITPFAVASELPFGYKGLFFWCEQRSVSAEVLAKFGHSVPPGMEIRVMEASILIPMDWMDQVKENRWKQMGGLVFCASQANDFWHKMFGEGQTKSIESRAQAWEAEFLNHLMQWPESGFVLHDDYQIKIMEKWPLGLASLPPELRYNLKPFKAEDFIRIDKNEEVSDVP